MDAIVLTGDGEIEVAQIDDPVAGEGDVIIAPEVVGICGTDIHLACGDYPTGAFPIVPGHEFAGTVVRVGAAVEGFKAGDRVCVDPNIACARCAQCQAGAINLCRNLVPIGVACNGAAAELVKVPARVVFPLPDDIDWTTAALIEPLACVLHALGRTAPVAGRRVLIYGAGSIGLLATAVAAARGAATIEVIEPSPVRREAAVEFGAHAVFGPGERRPDGRDADLVIEASGHPSAVTDAIARLADRGTLLQMGVVSPQASIDFHPYDLFDREMSFIGSQSLATSYPEAVEAIRGLPDLAARMVTHRFGLTGYKQALEAARSDAARKVHVLPQQ